MLKNLSYLYRGRKKNEFDDYCGEISAFYMANYFVVIAEQMSVTSRVTKRDQ